MIRNVLLALALAAAFPAAPEAAQLDQALMSFEILKDGELQFAQGVVAMRDKPGYAGSVTYISHRVMRCAGGVSMSSTLLPNGYALEAQLVGEQVDVRIARHIPAHFDAQIAKLKKRQCLEALPTDQIVFSSQQLIAAETNGVVARVDLGDGYVLRYNSHLDLYKAGHQH
ncbi:hypothetical protein [Xanthomonas arboricola]|uniref:hypothetical protein n=1 Tax=Xanthomonas arboricola TaxID=56448 RepID=UPI0016149803|nr:hypothetical protein [Xanthomonas arboricola]MBB3759227.1 hypothetical protein [Xanthomonas arboricola]